MSSKIPITVAYGDGIGPEIMKATLKILEAAGAQLDIEEIKVGMSVYEQGIKSGIEDSAWDSLRRTKVFLKAPITTPQGGGVKSLNVTIRKSMGLFANVRPCVAYHPFVETLHPDMDLVIIRENEEDVYAGIEHRQTQEVTQCLKLISQPGSERIIRYAFEYAKQNNRKKVTCFSKDNIMKITDGLFHKTYDQVALEYPEIENEHWIVDIGAARLADTPDMFDVIVMENLYGDILSDVAAEITGSVGLGGSANIGAEVAMFEAIHGSAPTIAGKNIANPSGLLLSAVMMLVHVGQPEVAEKIHNAWLKTIEEGIHTPDIFNRGVSHMRVGTEEFTENVIMRLGQIPIKLNPVTYNPESKNSINITNTLFVEQKKELRGVDVFIDWRESDRNPDILAERLQKCKGDFTLKVITNRGVKVWPQGMRETFKTDHWRCRFVAEDTIPHQKIVELLSNIDKEGLDFIKTEGLFFFDGAPGYSLAQGE